MKQLISASEIELQIIMEENQSEQKHGANASAHSIHVLISLQNMVLGGTIRRKKLLSPKSMDVCPLVEVVKGVTFKILQEEYDTHDPKGHIPTVLTFLKRRSQIVEIVAAHDIVFGLAQSGVCATFSRENNKRICLLNISPDEVIRSLFFNKNNDSLITNAAKARKSLKWNGNNRFAQRKLDYYEPKISRVARYYQCFEDLPSDWKYDPETSFMAHVPKPPPPPKPKTKKKKKIKITWSSPNYHGRYPLNNHEQKVWNEFTMSDTTEAYDCECFPIKNLVMVQKDEGIVNLLGKFAADTFNKSCHMYVNKDEDNMVGKKSLLNQAQDTSHSRVPSSQANDKEMACSPCEKSSLHQMSSFGSRELILKMSVVVVLCEFGCFMGTWQMHER